jgi:1-acyl-sn-glycerol-3-phosphate acyltransferase
MFYIAKLTAIAVITIPLSMLTILCGLGDPLGKKVYRISKLWTWLILKIGGIALNVEGLKNLDPQRQYLFVVNHQSNIDIPVLVQALANHQLRWIAKKELLWVPFFGWAMWAAKHIAVDRDDSLSALRSLELAKRRIAAGISVVIFPEGTRSTDGRLLPFKRGGFLLALKTKTPIVPVTINGTGKLLPKGDWRIRQGEVTVNVGAPLTVENFRRGGLRGLSAQVEELIAAQLSASAPNGIGQERLTQPAISARS